MRNMYGSHEANCIAAIYGFLQQSIATQSASVVVKYDEESTYDFLQRTIGVHGGMKVSCDLGGGTYLVVKGLATSVQNSGYALQFDRDEYDVQSQCVVSWNTECGNYATAHLYKLSNFRLSLEHLAN